MTRALEQLDGFGGMTVSDCRGFGHEKLGTEAAIGIVVNTATALLFMAGRKGDLNIKGAFLHMAADAGVSAGVVLAGLAIRATGWVWLDPAISLVIVAVILVGTWGLLRDSVNLAMDAVPEGTDAAAVKDHLMSLPG